MTLNYRGKTIVGLSHGGKRIVKRYRGDQLVWSAYVPEGTVLWQESDKYGNQTVNLKAPLSKVKNGVEIAFASKVRLSTASVNYYSGSIMKLKPQSPVKVVISDLLSGKPIKLSKSQLYYSGGSGETIKDGDRQVGEVWSAPVSLTVKMVDDDHLYLELFICNVATSQTGKADAILDSITAY